MFDLQSPSADPGRVVVLGASGVLGKALLAALDAAGVRSLGLASADLDLLAGDAAERLAGMLTGEDAVVVLSALTPDRGRDIATLMRNLRMAEAVCAALKATPVSHVVYMSSDAVYPFTSGLVSEDSPAAPADLYGTMHRTREIMFADTVRESPLACLRCTLVLAADDTHNSYGPNRFRRQAAAEGRIVLGGGGEETRDLVLAADVARLTVEVLRGRGAGTLNLASGQSHSFFEIAGMVRDAMSATPEVATTAPRAPITHRHFDSTLLRRRFPDFRFTPLDEAIRGVHRELGLA